MRQQYRSRTDWMKAAAFVILFVNVGAVIARNYYESVINVGGEGFSVTGAETDMRP